MSRIVCVEMDYSADPLWLGSEDSDDIFFINDSLDEYNNLLSTGLLHSLKLFQCTWEHFHCSKYKSVFDFNTFPGAFSTKEYLNTLIFLCAAQIKKEHPDWRVFYTNMYDYIRIELK